MFCTIADEYTDLSNKEQLTLSLRWVDDDLQAHEDFLGFYHIPNINFDTIVAVINPFTSSILMVSMHGTML